ncbi:hypothetical protein MKX01_006535 [Papaver californicum]|nr:hypothetical protein MKX01_006535 [Papaver californicum]
MKSLHQKEKVNDGNARHDRQNDDTSECSGTQESQKVSARWNPNGACRPMIDEALVFYPNDEVRAHISPTVVDVGGCITSCFSSTMAAAAAAVSPGY